MTILNNFDLLFEFMNKIDDEVVAAITAVLSSLNRGAGIKLVVKSFRRVEQSSPIWCSCGRSERLSKRLNS